MTSVGDQTVWYGPLGAGQTVTLTYQVRVTVEGGALTNTAFSANPPVDPTTGRPIDPATGEVVPVPEIDPDTGLPILPPLDATPTEPIVPPADCPAPTCASTTTEVHVPIKFGSVTGVVWDDLDSDGVRDPGEGPIEGVTVTLLDADGQPVLNEAGDPITAITGPDGSYTLDGVPVSTTPYAKAANVAFVSLPPVDPTTGRPIDPATGDPVPPPADPTNPGVTNPTGFEPVVPRTCAAPTCAATTTVVVGVPTKPVPPKPTVLPVTGVGSLTGLAGAVSVAGGLMAAAVLRRRREE